MLNISYFLSGNKDSGFDLYIIVVFDAIILAILQVQCINSLHINVTIYYMNWSCSILVTFLFVCLLCVVCTFVSLKN